MLFHLSLSSKESQWDRMGLNFRWIFTLRLLNSKFISDLDRDWTHQKCSSSQIEVKKYHCHWDGKCFHLRTKWDEYFFSVDWMGFGVRYLKHWLPYGWNRHFQCFFVIGEGAGVKSNPCTLLLGLWFTWKASGRSLRVQHSVVIAMLVIAFWRWFGFTQLVRKSHEAYGGKPIWGRLVE